MSAFGWSRRLISKLAAVGGSIAVITTFGTNYKLNVAHAAKPQPWTFYEPSVLWDYNWDKRDPESLIKPNFKKDPDSEECKEAIEKVSPSATRHLFLIRHGQYCMDGDEDKDRCLSKLGQEQAELTGQRLKELDLPFTVLIHSTMMRAIETADIIKKHLLDVPVETSDLIREGAPIPPEPPVGHWRPEAQQFYEDGARIEAAFRKYFHRADSKQTDDSYEVLVCHANVIRYFVCRAMQFPPEAWLRFTVHNCSITWITIHASGRVILRALGDSGHIPAEKLSTS